MKQKAGKTSYPPEPRLSFMKLYPRQERLQSSTCQHCGHLVLLGGLPECAIQRGPITPNLCWCARPRIANHMKKSKAYILTARALEALFRYLQFRFPKKRAGGPPARRNHGLARYINYFNSPRIYGHRYGPSSHTNG